MPQLLGLIFDLDGTLVDSAPDLRQALNATLAAEGHSPLGLEEVKDLTGDGMLPMLARAYAKSGARLSDAEAYGKFQKFVANYRGLKGDPSQIYPGVREALDFFQNKGVKMGVCTNKQGAATHKLLDDLDLSRYFKFVAGGDTFPTHKPHPDHVLGVIKKLDVPKENCAMVGDGPNDTTAARGAGIPCLVVTHGYAGDYGRLKCDGFIDGFGELGATLKKLGFQL